MAAADVSCALVQVETAIADLTTQLNQLPKGYRGGVSRELRDLKVRFHRLVDVCLGLLADPPVQKPLAPETKAVRIAHLGTRARFIRNPGGPNNRAPALGGQNLALPLLAHPTAPRLLAGRSAQEDHLAQEQRFRLIGKAVNGIVYDWNLRTNQVSWSQGLHRLLGFPPEEVHPAYAWWSGRVHPDDRGRVESLVDQIRQGKRESYDLLYRVQDRSGRWLALWDQGSVALDAQGTPLFAAGLCQDITRQKELEDTLRETNQALLRSNLALRATDEQFRVALANAPITVFRTDAALRYVWFYHPQMGAQAAQMLGKRDDEVFPDANGEALLRLKREALEGGKLIRKEVALRLNNQRRQMIVNLEPLFDSQRQPVGLVGAYTDITDLRRLENQEREKNFLIEVDRRLMEHRERERQKLAYQLHEGPIQTLSGLTFSLHVAKQMVGDGEASGVIGHISDELKRSIVDLRQVTYELRPAGLARFGLVKAIQLYADDFQERYPQIEVKLALENPANRLPQHDSLVLFRILQESFSNVARHAHASQVWVALRVEGRRVRLEIRDNGQGFSVHYDWLKLIRQGRYGLVGMKERAEAIGGKLKVRSRRKEGTTVLVVVPQEIAPPAAPKE